MSCKSPLIVTTAIVVVLSWPALLAAQSDGAVASAPPIGIKCAHSGQKMPMNLNRRAVLVTVMNIMNGKIDDSQAFGLNQVINNRVHRRVNDFAHPGCWTIVMARPRPHHMPVLCVVVRGNHVASPDPNHPKTLRYDPKTGSVIAACPRPRYIGGWFTYTFWVINNL